MKCIFIIQMMEYQRMKMMRKGKGTKGKKKEKASNQRKEDPKEFSEVFKDPAEQTLSLLLDKIHERMTRKQRNMDGMNRMRHMMMGYGGMGMGRMNRREIEYMHMHGDFGDDFDPEEMFTDKRSELQKALEKDHHSSFDQISTITLNKINNDTQRLQKFRKDSIAALRITDSKNEQKIKQLEMQNCKQKLQKIKQILQKKVENVRMIYLQRKKTFLWNKEMKDLFVRSKGSDIEFTLKQLSEREFGKQLIVRILSQPPKQKYTFQMNQLQSKLFKIMDETMKKDEDTAITLTNLPYKECSEYWTKLVTCFKRIPGSAALHYKVLIQPGAELKFQTEYVGIVDQEHLRTLIDQKWIQNKITSAVIEYFRYVEGANDYLNDNSRKAYIFNHSETNIFVQSNRQSHQANNYLDYQKLIFLVNAQESHWLVIVFYNFRKEIVVYDSLGGYNDICMKYIRQIENKLKNEASRRKLNQNSNYNVKREGTSPQQRNLSDCGVFSIINMIMAFDKHKDEPLNNVYDVAMITHVRHGLFLFMLYLGYCKKANCLPRKDNFTFLLRSTIYFNSVTKLHTEYLKTFNKSN